MALRILPRLIIVSAWLACLALGSPASAYETDPITGRYQVELDAREPLNRSINATLAQVVEEVGGEVDSTWTFEEVGTRFREALFRHARPWFGLYRPIVSPQEAFLEDQLLEQGYGFRKLVNGQEVHLFSGYASRVGEHIRRVIDFKAFLLADWVYGRTIAHNFLIAGVQASPDKLGHFLRGGYQYWIRNPDGTQNQRMLAHGTERENGLRGFAGSGVFSFADLAANYAGYEFTRDVIVRDENGAPGAALFWWDGGQIRQRRGPDGRPRSFDIADYITSDWDEYRNPPAYSELLGEIVRGYLNAQRDEICGRYRSWRSREVDPATDRKRFRLRALSQYVDLSAAPERVDPFRLDELCGIGSHARP
jgi:hypothetical protein